MILDKNRYKHKRLWIIYAFVPWYWWYFSFSLLSFSLFLFFRVHIFSHLPRHSRSLVLVELALHMSHALRYTWSMWYFTVRIDIHVLYVSQFYRCISTVISSLVYATIDYEFRCDFAYSQLLIAPNALAIFSIVTWYALPNCILYNFVALLYRCTKMGINEGRIDLSFRGTDTVHRERSRLYPILAN